MEKSELIEKLADLKAKLFAKGMTKEVDMVNEAISYINRKIEVEEGLSRDGLLDVLESPAGITVNIQDCTVFCNPPSDEK